MKPCKWLVCGLMVVAFVAGPLSAGDVGGEQSRKAKKAGKKKGPGKSKSDKPKKKGRGKPKSIIRGEYAILTKAAALTDVQKAKLEKAIKAYKESVGALEKASAEKLKELDAKYEQAKAAKNKEEMKKIKAEKKLIQAQPLQLRKELWQTINGMLSHQQKRKYGVSKLHRSMIGKFRKAKLTEDQEKAVRKLCAEGYGRIAAAKDEKEKAKLQGQVRKELKRKIHDQVLTDEQREAMKARVAKKPKSDKPKKTGPVE